VKEFENLVGRRIGSLLVIGIHKVSRNGGKSWRCKCDCGNECIKSGSALRAGKKLTCGKCKYGVYKFDGDSALCSLPDGSQFVIDNQDYPLVSKYQWRITPHGYFMGTNGSGERIFLHRLIMNPPEGKFVDHVDCNKANCRRSNMRICDKTQNNRNIGLQKNNQCGYKGVYWAADRSKWRAEITVDRRHIHIGSFDTAEEAADAYDEMCLLYFGEFARTNAMLNENEQRKMAV